MTLYAFILAIYAAAGLLWFGFILYSNRKSLAVYGFVTHAIVAVIHVFTWPYGVYCVVGQIAGAIRK